MSQTTERLATRRTSRNAIKIINQAAMGGCVSAHRTQIQRRDLGKLGIVQAEARPVRAG